MSDTSQGEGWWQALDGKWYPPDRPQPPPPSPAQPPLSASGGGEAEAGKGPKPPPGLDPAPEIASYADVVWYRKTWLLVLSLLVFPVVAIVVALTGDTYQKANRRMKAVSPAEVWRYNDRGRWIMVAVAVALLLFGWVRVGLGI